MEFTRIDPESEPGPTPLSESELAAQWISAPSSSAALAAAPAPRRPRGAASSILMAAMLGLTDALGFERPRDETVEVADAPMGGDDLELRFGHLEPLDR